MDIEKRVGKGKSTFRRLRRVWNSKKYSKKTKTKLYNAVTCQTCVDVRLQNLKNQRSGKRKIGLVLI